MYVGHVFLYPGEAMTEAGSLVTDERDFLAVFSHFLRVASGVEDSPNCLAIRLYAWFHLAGSYPVYQNECHTTCAVTREFSQTDLFVIHWPLTSGGGG